MRHPDRAPTPHALLGISGLGVQGSACLRADCLSDTIPCVPGAAGPCASRLELASLCATFPGCADSEPPRRAPPLPGIASRPTDCCVYGGGLLFGDPLCRRGGVGSPRLVSPPECGWRVPARRPLGALRADSPAFSPAMRGWVRQRMKR